MAKEIFYLNEKIGLAEGRKTVWERMDELGKEQIPFLFLSDFKNEKVEIFPLENIEKETLLFDIQGFTNKKSNTEIRKKFSFKKYPISFSAYLAGFNLVKKHIHAGDTFLANYTCATPIKTDLSLKQIFYLGEARYKVFYKNRFVFFSPETFVKIENGRISTYPMKGTIDASLPNAEQQILNDKKETAEHNTIVDLLRNDLSRVAKKVKVDRFRYVEKIKTNGKDLLQVSSEISGQLPENWKGQIGHIFQKLLPAGSISGAPKKKTIEIIEATEKQSRGFYTGIVGLFDGEKLDSGVAIRFIEKTAEGLQFRSGGGVTCFSKAEKEYEEMIDKVYLPKKIN